MIVSLIVALITIAFDSTYVDQDDLPVVTSGTSRDSGSRLCAESSWDRVALTPPLDMTYHVRKRRIRSTRVVVAAIERAKFVTGDTKMEVDDESIERSGQGVHWY